MAVNDLADELLEIQFRAQPMWPALLGVDMTRPGLGEITEADEEHTATAVQDVLTRAEAIDAENLDGRDATTLAVVKAVARNHVDAAGVQDAEFTVTDMFVAPASRLLAQLPMLGVADTDAQESYVDRLRAVGEYLPAALERHRAGVAKGRVPVKHLVEAAIGHLDRYLATPDDDPLRRPTPPEPGDFAAQRDQVLENVVRPAFKAYRDGLAADIAPHARPADQPGLCWLPDGDELYATSARIHTTTDRTPGDLHRTGLDLIDKLAGEYVEIGGRVFGTGDLTSIFDRLREDPSLRWKDADELLDAARATVERAAAEAPKWFGRIPTAECVVEPVPASAAPGMPAAYYMQPATDGSRPGTYFANTYEASERFKHTSEVIAFHEAIPGHHFQISLAQGMHDVPMLRRVAGFNAYVEGWGLYTERLADEMGLYSGDVARLGMLTVDSMRAGRLVVDTGLHALGWSRRQAIEFLQVNTPMPAIEIEAEVDRYIAYPGQALSYMVGRLELLRLREKAAQALGEAFDIKAFHDVVLGNGALPLDVLDTVVTSWIDGQASS